MLLLAGSSFAIDAQQECGLPFCKTDIPVAACTYNKTQVLPPASADLHVRWRAIHSKQNAFSGRKDKKTEENNFTKNNSTRMLLLAESSFAIDAQQERLTVF